MSEQKKDVLGRVVLGCSTVGQCFCTGRCKRTAEEQARHEQWQGRLPVGSPFDCGADISRVAQSVAANLVDQDARLRVARDKVQAQKGAHDSAMAALGRQTFEPKPGHGPASDPMGVFIGNADVEHLKLQQAARAQEIAHAAEVASLRASALDTQVGGDHYKKLKIQPMEYSMANGLDACQHTIVKYVTRFRDKGGVADLEKARHCIDMLIEFEGKSK